MFLGTDELKMQRLYKKENILTTKVSRFGLAVRR